MRFDKQRLPVVLALVAAAVLLTGILNRSTQQGNVLQEITISAAELKGVRELAERNSQAAFRDRVAAIADRAAQSLVWSDQWRSTGIIWRPGEAAVARNPLAQQRTANLRLKDATRPATPRRWAPGLPFATVGLEVGDDVVPARAKLENIVAGNWLVAVTLQDQQRLFLPATLSGLIRSECEGWPVLEVHLSLPLPDEFVGGGIFTLDGELVALIADCGQDVVALSLPSVEQALARLDQPAGTLLTAYGAAFVPLTDALRAHFGAEQGVLVNAVWHHWPADEAGLLPGDIIVQVGEQPVASVAVLSSLREAIDRGEPIRFRRHGRIRSIILRPVSPVTSGLVLRSGSRNPSLEAVPLGSKEYSAGLRPGDELLFALAPGGSSTDVHKVAQSAAAGALYVAVRRPGKTQGAFLAP